MDRAYSLTLLAAVIGAAVLSTPVLGIGFGAAAIGDITILLALFAFDELANRSGSQSIAFAAVAAFCLLTPLSFLAINVLGVTMTPAQAAPGSGKSEASWIIFGMWAVCTLILFSVDRFRMSARDNVSLGAAGLAAAGPIQPIVTKVPAYRPAPIRVEPVIPHPAAPPPPIYEPAVAAAAPVFSAPVFETPVAAAAPAIFTPPPDVTAIPPGREALIYLNLVGEGLNVLRTVRAENLGRDYFRIADVMPEGEQWEYTPGMVVRCRKKNLSNGKHMVAYEEAPRAV